jgi:alpha-glucosidase
LTWEETVDPSACNTQDPINYEKSSRDGCRTPFPWNSSKNAGFSVANKTWLPVSKDYETMNVEAQRALSNSHLKIFKKLVQLRKDNVLRQGLYEAKLINDDNVIIYKRTYGTDIVVVILNFGSSSQNVNAKTELSLTQNEMTVYTASLDTFAEGVSQSLSSISVPANKAVVLTNLAFS